MYVNGSLRIQSYGWLLMDLHTKFKPWLQVDLANLVSVFGDLFECLFSYVIVIFILILL